MGKDRDECVSRLLREVVVYRKLGYHKQRTLVMMEEERIFVWSQARSPYVQSERCKVRRYANCKYDNSGDNILAGERIIGA